MGDPSRPPGQRDSQASCASSGHWLTLQKRERRRWHLPSRSLTYLVPGCLPPTVPSPREAGQHLTLRVLFLRRAEGAVCGLTRRSAPCFA